MSDWRTRDRTCKHGHLRTLHGVKRSIPTAKRGWHWYCRECQRLYRKSAWAVHENLRLRRLYGITLREYGTMLDAQGGLCAACHQEPNVRLQVDHDHKTGKVRGLLCRRCNVALSYMEGNVMKELLAYLRHEA